MYYILSNERTLYGALKDAHSTVHSNEQTLENVAVDGQYIHTITLHGTEFVEVTRTVRRSKV